MTKLSHSDVEKGAIMADKSCDTCIHKSAESLDPNGGRIVDCDANELQMYSPFVEECKHWERAIDEE